MLFLEKSPKKDFIVLNLTDPQLGADEWAQDHRNGKILRYTVDKLMEKMQPDLVTVTGDISHAGGYEAYDRFADMMEGYGVPWAPVWGNHDNQGGESFIDGLAERYMERPHCLYEKGDPSLGNGNYVIAIMETGKPVEGLIMMDSHDRMPYVNEQGETTKVWAKLLPDQLIWYRQQVKALTDMGCHSTSMFMHIPIFAYTEAWDAAFNSSMRPEAIGIEESYGDDCWNNGYTDSFGVKYEDICSYPVDEGAFDVIRELQSTKHIVCGHDHVNNFVVCHKGVKFVYALKTGAGCYWKSRMSGGTVLQIGSSGAYKLWHEYINAGHIE